MPLSLSTVTKPAARALAMLPGSPWYWAAGAAFLAVVFGARAAGAEAGGSGSHPQPGGALPLLKSGSSGPWVSFLQSLLAVPASGTFDAATVAAVKAKQEEKALTADGIVGPNTWKALGVAAQGGAPAPGGGSAPAPKPGGAAPSPGPAPVPTATNVFGLADGVDARESQILAFAGQGLVDPDLVPLSWSRAGHTVTVMVTRRALALQDSRGRLMFSMSFKGAQQLLDQLGLIMLTTRVADEAWNQGKRMAPTNQPWNTDSPVTGGKTARMIEQSAKVEQKVGGDGGIIANEGKDWVLTRRFWTPPEGSGVETPQGTKSSRHNSANFGLYMPGPGWSKSPGGADVIQSIGLAHERSFVDYSQLVRGMASNIVVDGQNTTAAAVLSDPALAPLLSDEVGYTLPATRHPDL